MKKDLRITIGKPELIEHPTSGQKLRKYPVETAYGLLFVTIPVFPKGDDTPDDYELAEVRRTANKAILERP